MGPEQVVEEKVVKGVEISVHRLAKLPELLIQIDVIAQGSEADSEPVPGLLRSPQMSVGVFNQVVKLLAGREGVMMKADLGQLFLEIRADVTDG